MDSGYQKYQDIIDLERPLLPTYPRMDLAARSAQFSPFAALTGHGEIVDAEEKFSEAMLDERVIVPEVDDNEIFQE